MKVKGKKGGNNVSSLLIKEFTKNNILNKDTPAKEAAIIMDNCGGQNKNNMVLRLSVLLVELGYFEKVNFVFYIVGHTKNAADRWFNQLKKKYRRSNLYSYNDLLESMETHKNISVRKVEDGDFKEMEIFLNKFYKRLKPGTISKIMFSQLPKTILQH
jgi:hypothetical protein